MQLTRKDCTYSSRVFPRERTAQCCWEGGADAAAQPQVENGLNCDRHKNLHTPCDRPHPFATDILFADGPCQPFSTYRAGCGVSDCRRHKDHAVTFGSSGSIISVTEKLLPKVVVTEQVGGFNNVYDKESEATPLLEYIERMMKLRRRNPLGTEWHFEGFASVPVDSAASLEGTRTRLIYIYIYVNICVCSTSAFM